jgi:hypothetical protein
MRVVIKILPLMISLGAKHKHRYHQTSTMFELAAQPSPPTTVSDSEDS